MPTPEEQRVNDYYSQNTPWYQRLWDSTLGGVFRNLPGMLSGATNWIADKLGNTISPDTTRSVVPLVAALGIGGASYFAGSGMFGNSMLGTLLGVGGAALAGIISYSAFSINNSSGTTLTVPAANPVTMVPIGTPSLTPGLQVQNNTNNVPVIDRALTTPPNVQWNDIWAARARQLAESSRISIATATAQYNFQAWEEAVRSINENVRQYNTYTRDVMAHQVGTFGLTARDIEIWGAIPAAPTAPQILVGSNNLPPNLDGVGNTIFAGNTENGGWVRWNVSTKLNHLRERVQQNRALIDGINLTGERWDIINGTYYVGEGVDWMRHLNGVHPGDTRAYNTRAIQAEMYADDHSRPSLASALALYNHVHAQNYGSHNNTVRQGATALLMKAIEPHLATFDREFHDPHRTALQAFSATGGPLDQWNTRVANMQTNFQALVNSATQHRVAVLRFQAEPVTTGTPTDAHLIVKDLTNYEFGTPASALTRTFRLRRESNNTYTVTGWRVGEYGTDWNTPPSGTTYTINNPNDPAQIRQLLNTIGQTQLRTASLGTPEELRGAALAAHINVTPAFQDNGILPPDRTPVQPGDNLVPPVPSRGSFA
jgi:hypothetical protein